VKTRVYKKIEDLEVTIEEILQTHLELSKNFITPFDERYSCLSGPIDMILQILCTVQHLNASL
jgi:hypothetical protein